MKTVIEAHNLSKSFKTGGSQSDEIRTTLRQVFSGKWKRHKDEFWALKDINFEVEEGDSFAILGQNGAGKSTLLKILSKITLPTTGYVKMRSQVTSLLQTGTGFHNELSGRDNIILGGVLLGMKIADIKKNMDAIIDFSELEKFIDTPLKYYSSGMRARLGFSSSVFLRSEIIILDEVLATGDMAFKKKSLERMSEIITGGTTVIFVSHSLSEVKKLCNRAMFLEKGQIKGIGDVEEMIRMYEMSNRPMKELTRKVSPKTVGHSKIVDWRIDQIGQVKGKFVKGAPLEIYIKVQVLKPIDQLDVQLNLYEGEGENVLFTNYFTDKYPSTPFVPGLYEVKASIPADILVKGKYRVAIGQSKHKSGVIIDSTKLETKIVVLDVGNLHRPSNKRFGGRITIPVNWTSTKVE